MSLNFNNQQRLDIQWKSQQFLLENQMLILEPVFPPWMSM